MPSIRDLILHKQVLTPLDIERTTSGLSEGNIFQGELSLEQLFFNRPVPGYARYKTPLQEPLAQRLGDASRRRDHGRVRPHRRARAAEGEEAAEGRVAVAERYDAIVIGAGHNGLVTAAYLGEGGLRTLVLERRDRVGGALATTELGKARVPAAAHTVGRLRRSVVRDLGLDRHGFVPVTPDGARVRTAARRLVGDALGRPGPDGGRPARPVSTGRRRVRRVRQAHPRGASFVAYLRWRPRRT